MSISFIVPCKNEQENIEDTTVEIEKCVGQNYDYEIIIIDDSSTDNTRNIINKLKQNNKKIIQINNDVNLGYGGSFIKGLKYANKNYVNLMPGDNCFPASEIKKIISNLNNLDLIITTPREINDEREIHRKLFSRLFTIIVNLLFGYKLNYYNGIPLAKTSVLKKINITSSSPFFMAEMVLKILKMNLNYEEREVYFIERKKGKSSIFNFKTILKTIKDLIIIRMKY